MKLLILSDHTAQQINRAEQTRELEYQTRLAQHKDAVARIRVRKDKADQALGSAWQDFRIGGILSGVKEWLGSRLASTPATPVKGTADRQEIVWTAGKEGEQVVLQALSHQLNDAWTVMAGYRNRSGEIDLVAVGPEGVAAIEIKYLNGVVSCEGDLWFRDKYDKYGNLVEQGLSVADRRGRSPSRQLNETTDTLATFLAQRKVSGHILRVVVLSHPMSRLGTLHQQTVDWVSTVESLDLPAFCRGRCAANSPSEIERIVGLIQKDHAFINRPRTLTQQQT